uniref:Uncharacterized protein n=1 Tax=Macaca nemestrina TaxID=9545 RepID=A0A2K6AW52_MACNE
MSERRSHVAGSSGWPATRSRTVRAELSQVDAVLRRATYAQRPELPTAPVYLAAVDREYLTAKVPLKRWRNIHSTLLLDHGRFTTNSCETLFDTTTFSQVGPRRGD